MSEKFPRGQLSADDEGATQMAITVKDKTVIILFPHPMAWIGLDKATALTLAAQIKERAESIK